MQRFNWSRLNKQQVGAYTETEVDDRGVDFVARYEEGRLIEVQVSRSARRHADLTSVAVIAQGSSDSLRGCLMRMQEGYRNPTDRAWTDP
jgi:hypothetical protein